MDWSALTIPEVVGIVGLAGTLLAVYKGTVDAKKLSPAASLPAPVGPATHGEVTVDIDKRYVEAMESLSVAFSAVATANTRLGEANTKQTAALEAIGGAITGWIHKYEREKDEDRLEALETQLARIYNIIAPPETQAVRRKRPLENT